MAATEEELDVIGAATPSSAPAYHTGGVGKIDKQDWDAEPEILEFWESERTRPEFMPSNAGADDALARGLDGYLTKCMEHPFLSAAEIQKRQLARIKELVELAYADIPVYRDKYRAAEFSPDDLREWDDIQKIPVISKPELIDAFPDRCLNPRFDRQDLFPTRSSGSSGQTLLIRVDYDAILSDTIQGVRQFIIQSGLKYRPCDLLTHIYTVPWWFPSAGPYRTAFISNLIPPARAARHLRQLSPGILSLYPSNLKALMPYREEFREPLYLTVTHSECSSRAARQAWSRQLDAPVLDEYSSEEGTRIALELPCGHYHVCEDTVRLDVLDPETMKPQTPGQLGLAVVTNLLNEAMPFIRYMQGDYITQPADPEPCCVHWSQIASIDGRMNDAFINRRGRLVPAGSILDITYRWMFDRSIHIGQFEMIQRGPDLIEARFQPGPGEAEARLYASIAHLEDLLAECFEHPVRVNARLMEAFPPRPGKHRPIRRELTE